ncbi:MAG: DUF4097 family beta strand repeat-containing protein [Trebonia sp.]
MTALSAAALPMTRARRAALVIGVPVCLLLVASTGLSLVADLGEGQYPVSYTVPASTKGLALNTSGGRVAINQAASGPVTLAGTARYSLIRSTVSERTVGGVSTVGYRCPIPVGFCELDATVSVPAAMPVTASTGGGDVAVTGTTGPVTLSSGGGNLSANHTSGPLRLKTGGGDVTATAITSPTLTASSSGGNIRAAGVTSAAVSVSTGGGDINVVFTSVPSDVQLSTSGGNITLVLPPGDTPYHVTTHTAGGNVSDGSVPTSSSSTHVITATSGGGDITISQQ